MKASAVSIMCASDLSDFRIMARSGHSSKAVEEYKRAIPKNLLEETEILFGRNESPKKKMKLESEIKIPDKPKISSPLFNINFNAPIKKTNKRRLWHKKKATMYIS